MADVFDIRSSPAWTYVAEVSTVLATTTVAHQTNPGLRYAKGPMIVPAHDAAYWDRVTAGFDFSEADQVPVAQFNRLLWAGLKGGTPYPALRGRAGTTCRRTWPGCSGANRRVAAAGGAPARRLRRLKLARTREEKRHSTVTCSTASAARRLAMFEPGGRDLPAFAQCRRA